MVAGYTWFLTGASRDIGLEMTRQLLHSPWHTVFASCRSAFTATELGSLTSSGPGNLHVIKLDVTDEKSIKAGTAEVLRILDGRGLDYVINNAAVNLAPDNAFTSEPEHLATSIVSNVMAPALVSRYLLPAIERGNRKVIANLTSTLASIGWDRGPTSTGYGIGKTALSILTYKQAKERPDFVPLLVDPGWVKTKMGGPAAILEPRASVKGVLRVIRNATAADAGKFYNYQGKEIFW